MKTGSKEEKINFIKYNSNIYSIKILCFILEISESTFQRDKNTIFWDMCLVNFIQTIIRNQPYLGYRKVCVYVRMFYDLDVGEHKIRKYCKHFNLQATLNIRKKFSYPLAPDSKVKFENKIKNIKTTKTNQVWTTDITYIPTKEGTLYECLIRDKHNGAIVASKTSRYFTSDLLKDMTVKALLHHKIQPGELTIHSDHGCQYASHIFIKLLEKYQVEQSMSSLASPNENQGSEQLFSQLKRCVVNKKRKISMKKQVRKVKMWKAQHNYIPSSIYKSSRLNYNEDKKLVQIYDYNIDKSNQIKV